MLGAAIMSPSTKRFWGPRLALTKTTANACSRLNDLRREHPHLKAIKDALASNGPHINHLKNKDFVTFSEPR